MKDDSPDWKIFLGLFLGVLTFPFWGIPDMVRAFRFKRRLQDSRQVIAFDGEVVQDARGVVALSEVVRARMWSYETLSMASGADETALVELRLRDGRTLRYAEGGPAFRALRDALIAAGTLAATPENGGNSGGVGRGLMVVAWMVILYVGALVAAMVYD